MRTYSENPVPPSVVSASDFFLINVGIKPCIDVISGAFAGWNLIFMMQKSMVHDTQNCCSRGRGVKLLFRAQNSGYFSSSSAYVSLVQWSSWCLPQSSIWSKISGKVCNILYYAPCGLLKNAFSASVAILPFSTACHSIHKTVCCGRKLTAREKRL